MDRRKFLVGLGSASIGGSALVGSGAFSRVEAQRSVTIQVAEDPDAYLGMAKCSIDGRETPNSSYAHLDDDGHLEILMNPDNPTTDYTYLGDGINSDSRMWVDNVFQLCNYGKEDVCVYIKDDDNWPRAPEEYDEERRVDFYPGANREESIIGEENQFLLPLGDCVCIGLKTNSKGRSEGDELLKDLDNEITIVADVDGDCIVRVPDLTIDVEQDADSALADGEDSIELTATVAHDGDPLEGADVEISHDGQDITLDPDQTTQTTDGDGQVIWNVSSETVQSDVEFTFTVEDDYDQTATDSVTKGFTELPACPFYGTTMGNPTQIHGIRGDPDDGISITEVGDLGDLSPDDIARPNGLAFDAVAEVWYFADDHPDEGDGVLYTMTATEDGGVDELVEYENITGAEGEGIAGAAFWDATGQYLFIEEGGSQLLAATVDVGDPGSADVEVVESDLLTSDIGLGDLAIDRDNEMLYISTASSADGQIFFSVDLTDTSEQEIIANEDDGDDRTHAINKQIAFEEREVGDDVLWAHHAWDGDWWTVDLETGEHVQDDPVANTPTVDDDHEDYPAGYSDLARCGFADVDGLRRE